MKSVKIISAVTAFLICASLILGTTFAWQSSSDSRLNEFYTAGVRGKITEIFEPPADGITAGASIEKTVNITNDSGTPIYVRVAAVPVISKEIVPEGGELLLPADVIELDYNSTHWLDGGDGYYYYKKLLHPGKTTDEPLFTKVKLSSGITDDFEGAGLVIYILSEVCGVNLNYGYRTTYWGGQAAGAQAEADAVFKQLADDYFR